jgi:transcriptional regulator with XRE-family HTH domain
VFIIKRISELVNSFCTDFQTFYRGEIMYEIYCKLRDERGVKDADVVKETGITKSTFSDWKNGRSKPKNDKLQKIADYFGVTLDYLTTGKESSEKKEITLTQKDERDIAKKLAGIMRDIKTQEDGPLYYNGQEIDQTSLELLESALNNAMHQMKIINKDKYNPHKNKK